MRLPDTGILILACCWSGMADAQLQLLPDREPQRVFAGADRKITMVWHNAGDEMVNTQISARIFQTSSATAVQSGEVSWKKLQVLPQQTVVESAGFDFPAVRAGTKFLVQWLENTNRIIGKTEALVYPTNLLDELKPLMGQSGETLGVLDPQGQIKSMLNQAAIKFVDLGEAGLDTFSGRLAIVGPCRPNDPEWNGLADRISQLAKRGTPVIWIQAQPAAPDKILPSFYIVPQIHAVVVVIKPELVADLAEDPQSQLNLIFFCKLAMNPKPPVLPDLSTQP
jgi:hypothetical protein